MKRNLRGQLYKLRFNQLNQIFFVFVLGVIALITLISMAVVLRKPWEHEKCVEKVENLNSNNSPSAATVRDVPHDLISTQSASKSRFYKLTTFKKTTSQQEKSSQQKKRVVRTTPESEYGVLIAKVTNAIGEIKKQKNKKITKKKLPTRKSTTVNTSPTVQTKINLFSNLQISRPGTLLSASKCSKAKCMFNDLCKKILVTDNNLWFNFPAEIMKKMTSEKRFNVRVLHETFKTKPNLPNFNEENIDTLVQYQLIFQQFTQNLKLVSLPKGLDNVKIEKFLSQIKQLENRILYTKNALQMKCGKIPNASKQNIVYLQGYEDLVIKGYNKEEILFILFNQINEIFLTLKNDFYKRQICLGDIQCSS